MHWYFSYPGVPGMLKVSPNISCAGLGQRNMVLGVRGSGQVVHNGTGLLFLGRIIALLWEWMIE